MAIRTTYKYACDLDKGTYEVNLRNALMQADSQADAFRVSVTRNGTDVDVSGMSAYGYLYVAANQTTIALAGAVSGNTAEVVLTSDCYAVPGYASLVIQLHDGDVRHTVLKVNLHIERTGSNRVLTGGDVLPTLAELLNKISEMEQTTATANATIATIKADTAAAIQTTNEATAAANTATVELAKTAGVPVVLTKTGSIVTITDGAERPAVSLVSHIEPVQEGEGDPSPDNVRPISGWDSVTAQRTGKNLIDSGISTDANCNTIVKLNVKAGTYKLTLYDQDGTTDGIKTGATFAARFIDDSDNTVIDRLEWGVSVTQEQASKIAAISYGYAADYYNGTSDRLYAQLEIGTTATPYEPYQGQTLTASLPETVYGGTVDWGTGKLVNDGYKIVIDGTNIAIQAVVGWDGVYSVYNIRAAGHPLPASGGAMACSHFPAGNVSANNFHVSPNNNGTIYIGSVPGISDAAAYNAWLASNPITCVYRVAEPERSQLTPQQLNTLKGTNNVWSDTGDTDLTYIADTQLYIDNKFSALEAALLSTGANV